MAVGTSTATASPTWPSANAGSNTRQRAAGQRQRHLPDRQSTSPSGTGPDSVAVGDFNGDGKPDLAAANQSGNTVSVLLNTTPRRRSPATRRP